MTDPYLDVLNDRRSMFRELASGELLAKYGSRRSKEVVPR